MRFTTEGTAGRPGTREHHVKRAAQPADRGLVGEGASKVTLGCYQTTGLWAELAQAELMGPRSAGFLSDPQQSQRQQQSASSPNGGVCDQRLQAEQQSEP